MDQKSNTNTHISPGEFLMKYVHTGPNITRIDDDQIQYQFLTVDGTVCFTATDSLRSHGTFIAFEDQFDDYSEDMLTQLSRYINYFVWYWCTRVDPMMAPAEQTYTDGERQFRLSNQVPDTALKTPPDAAWFF